MILLQGNRLRSGVAGWPRLRAHECATELVRGLDIRMVLTVFWLAAVISYSREVQQPRRAIAALGRHPHTHWAAPSDSDQGRAGGLHPEGQCSVDQTWTEREVYSRSSQLSVPRIYGLRSREPVLLTLTVS